MKKTDDNSKVMVSRYFQHEIDCLNGELFIEHMSKLKYEMAIKKAFNAKRHSQMMGSLSKI